MNSNKKKNDIKRRTIPATLILILIALLIVAVGFLYLSNKNGMTIDDLIDGIVGNLIGVLAAFLLFDIIYNKLTQDAYAKDTSEHITKTIMGDPITLDAFSKKDKKAFLKSTIKSLVKDDDAVDMISDNVLNSIDNTDSLKFRKKFNYTISLSDDFPENYTDFPNINNKKYLFTKEKLTYSIKYLNLDLLTMFKDNFKIGFSFSKNHLDDGLLCHDNTSFDDCIFNEILDLDDDVIQLLIEKFNSFDDNLQRVKYFNNFFGLALSVDATPCSVDNVEINSNGLIFELSSTETINLEENEHEVNIIFHMPKNRDSIFEVVLVDPTKDPKITFYYIPKTMDVEMYSYLSKKTSSNKNARNDQNGIYDIDIHDEWIYPKSGVSFSVKGK